MLIGNWGVANDSPSDVTIGGTTSSTGNIISANGEWGVWISGPGVTGVVVEGNTIGTDADSDTGLGNAYSGVQIDTGATNNTIGGTTAGAGNLISDNQYGVVISDTGTTGNVVEGNNIGLNSAQSAGLGNTYGGVNVVNGASDNTIGGTTSGAANTIAGNGTASTTSFTYSNVAIYDTGTTGNVVEGNFIGTTAASASGLNATSDDGVFVGYDASGNTIGGTSSAARNIISGNTDVGVVVYDAGPAGNTIEGNYVGTNVAGDAALANTTTGVLIESDGTTGEPSTNNLVIDNVLSGNGESGVAIENASENTVEDNLIGTGADGTTAVPNQWDGVHLELVQGSPTIGTGAWDNTIVGNTIDFNDRYGVLIEYSGSTGNSVQGNSIGTVGGNVLGGIMLDLGANGNSIGGTTANVISGNGGAGVTISGPGTSNNLVAGNFIGTTSGGTGGLGNSGDGVTITDGATGNTIGGTTAAAANTIAANSGNGVSFSTSGTTGNVVEGNYIGTNSAGAMNLGNTGDGVEVFSAASGNMIGGTVAGAGNVIDDNHTGVVIGSSPTDAAIHNAILGNSIYGNTDLGIDLGNDGVTLNDSSGHSGPNLFQDFPVITNAYTVGSTTTITGTVSGPANSTLRVELFSNPVADPSGYGQGQGLPGLRHGHHRRRRRRIVHLQHKLPGARRPVRLRDGDRRQRRYVRVRPGRAGLEHRAARHRLPDHRADVQPDQKVLHRDRRADQRRDDRGRRLLFPAREPDPRRDADQRQRLHGGRHAVRHGQHDPQSESVDHRDLDLHQDFLIVVHQLHSRIRAVDFDSLSCARRADTERLHRCDTAT